jgi:hypothetical protein
MTNHPRSLPLAFVLLACGGSGQHDSSGSGGGLPDAPSTGGGSGASAAGSASAGAAPNGSGGAIGAGAATGGVGGGASGADLGGKSGLEHTLGCAKWIVDDPSKSPVTATLGPEGLQLAYPAGLSSFPATLGDFSLAQDGLSGDFDITVSWQAFVPGDVVPFRGPKFAAGIYWYDPSGSVYSATGKVGGDNTQASLIHGEQFTINSLSPVEAPAFYEGASGSFRLQRSGSSVTVTSKVNGKSVTASSTEPFPEQPLKLALWFDAETGATASMQPSGITITDVRVTGGGGSVKPDDFSCP